jgi:FSR family fosmidomycin resistance protein-like MFS transporter
LPFTLALPYANLFWTAVLTIIIGVTIASAFTAILVYAQELMPGNIGLVSGIFFGFAFGMGGIGAAVLGKVADMTSIGFVYHVCSFLPAIGLLPFCPEPARAKLHREIPTNFDGLRSKPRLLWGLVRVNSP